MIGFVLEREGEAPVYLSGDTVWYDGVAEVARRFQVRTAVLFMGAARVDAVGDWPLTFTADGAVEAARAFAGATIVPLHFEGWAHFSETRAQVQQAFAAPGSPAAFAGHRRARRSRSSPALPIRSVHVIVSQVAQFTRSAPMFLPRGRAPGALIALLLWPGFLLAQHPDPGPLSDARRAIDRGNADYIAAFAKADADGVASVYDADGVRLGDDGKVLRGRRAIADDVRGLVQAVGPVAVTLVTARVWLVDDLAYETGDWSYTFTPKAKALQRVGGKYVTTWVRQADGGWRIKSDLAVPGT